MTSQTSYKSDFLRLLDERGYLHQVTEPQALDDAARAGTLTAYIGFDCTAPSLHVGNLVGIMMLRRLQQAGHKPIVLIGGGTTRIGDPSGKDDARQLLQDKQIEENIAGISKVFEKFLTFGDGPSDAIMVNNRDWLEGLSYIDFLRDYGRHFSVNRMLNFDSVRLRLDREQPLSFLEFNYMIVQAYDFVELFRAHGCTVQMGGSDQWGNIVNGIELGRRVDNASLYGVTTALLTTASGAKMGKTAEGAVWLNAEMRSVFDYWQFWRNTEDRDVGRFLKLFTDLPLDEIARLEKLDGAELNDAKNILATEATALAHGRQAAEDARETARQTFDEGMAAEGLPTVTLPSGEPVGILEAFVKAGLAKTNSEVRRAIANNAISVNDQRINDPQASLTRDDLNDDQAIKLSFGKKRHALIKFG